MRYPDTVILVFAKAPIPGEVNTRLIPDIGVEVATALQSELIDSRLASLTQSGLCEIQLWCSPDSNHAFFLECCKKYNVHTYDQTGRDLGERMSHAIKISLEKYKHVILIGTDAPSLDNVLIEQAISTLRTDSKTVIVPAEDGGYVLIGMSGHYQEIFLAVPWGTDRVMKKTRGNIIALGLKVNELSARWDIDRVEDYRRYKALQGG
jgi:rSAM/selenodomain-associated transferase 1